MFGSSDSSSQPLLWKGGLEANPARRWGEGYISLVDAGSRCFLFSPHTLLNNNFFPRSFSVFIFHFSFLIFSLSLISHFSISFHYILAVITQSL